MGSKAITTIAFLVISLNLLFFTMVSSTDHVPCGCQPSPPKSTPKYPPVPSPPKSTPKNPPVKPHPTPTPTPTPVTPKPAPTCPKDTLKLGVCASLLNDLLHLVVGTPPKTPCCSLIEGLVDLEAAICLCTAIKANVLGINLNVPVSLSLLLNYCGKNLPTDFKCT